MLVLNMPSGTMLFNNYSDDSQLLSSIKYFPTE